MAALKEDRLREVSLWVAERLAWKLVAGTLAIIIRTGRSSTSLCHWYTLEFPFPIQGDSPYGFSQVVLPAAFRSPAERPLCLCSDGFFFRSDH